MPMLIPTFSSGQWLYRGNFAASLSTNLGGGGGAQKQMVASRMTVAE